MELFSEIYSNYYTAVRRILEAGQEGPLCAADFCRMIDESAFSDSRFYMAPRLTGGEWELFKEEKGKFYPKTHAKKLNTPLTSLQKSWLKALLADRRMRLFLAVSEIRKLDEMLGDVQPLFYDTDFHYFDQASDGDRYEDEAYQKQFRTILQALREKSFLLIRYHGGKNTRKQFVCRPIELNYSQKDDKFRLEVIRDRAGQEKKMMLNLARIQSVEMAKTSAIKPKGENNSKEGRAFVLLQIMQERNALERCLVQFASLEKQTEYNPETDEYTCRIYYDTQDEADMIIRILGFGPVVKVLGPERVLTQIRERIEKQMELVLQ